MSESVISYTSDLSDDEVHRDLEVCCLQEEEDEATTTLPSREQHIEISVSLEYAEEHPSPSSVSLPQSPSEDLSCLIVNVPPMPVLPLHSGNSAAVWAVESPQSSVGPFTNRRRRGQEEGNSHESTLKYQTSSDSSGPVGNNNHSSRSIRIRSSPRFAVLLCAFTFVALSVHDRVEVSRQNYRLSSGSRREEVAFPLGHPDKILLSSSATATHEEKAPLPKYYLPQLESDATLKKTERKASTAVMESSSLRPHSPHGSNFAMARGSREVRPIFVPDQPLPGGGFRKPVERFVFDPEGQQRQFEQQRREEFRRTRSTASWTSWLASVAFIGMVLDTGWKEYHRCQMIQEEQRRL